MENVGVGQRSMEADSRRGRTGADKGSGRPAELGEADSGVFVDVRAEKRCTGGERQCQGGGSPNPSSAQEMSCVREPNRRVKEIGVREEEKKRDKMKGFGVIYE